jgi:segregation and condensation protein B
MDDHFTAMDRSGDRDVTTQGETAEMTRVDTETLQAELEAAGTAVAEPPVEAAPELEVCAAEAAPADPAAVIEALLFASDGALSAARLAELVGAGTARDVREHVAALNEKYAAAGLSFRVEELAGGYRLMTLAAYQPWLVKLNRQRSRTRLSDAALETLAIIGYKQPIIRAEVEAIRGVACGEALNRLRELGLIKIVGRAEMVGRPMLYGTTRKFLDVFGLADLDDLPPLEAIALRRRTEVEEAEPAAASA